MIFWHLMFFSCLNLRLNDNIIILIIHECVYNTPYYYLPYLVYCLYYNEVNYSFVVISSSNLWERDNVIHDVIDFFSS